MKRQKSTLPVSLILAFILILWCQTPQPVKAAQMDIAVGEELTYSYEDKEFSYEILSYPTESGPGTVLLKASMGQNLEAASIDLPDSILYDRNEYQVTELEAGAFEGYQNLQSIKLPIGLTKIGDLAFKNCSRLSSIDIPSGVIKIGIAAFDGTNLVTTVYPNSYAAAYCKANAIPYTYVTDNPNEVIPLEDIIIKPLSLLKNPGETENLSVVYYPDNTTDNRNVLWTSSNSNVAVIDQNGRLTANGAGMATITAVVGSKETTRTIIVNPSAPKEFKAVANGYNSIKLTWNAVSGISGYRLYRSVSKTGTYTLLGDSSSTSYTDKPLSDGKTYYYKLYSYSFIGQNETDSLSLIIGAAPKVSAPTNVKAKAPSKSAVVLTWDPVGGADGYDIFRATSPDGTYRPVYSVTACKYTDSTVTAGKTYYYKIKAYDTGKTASVFSGYSKTVSIKPVILPLPKAVTIGTSLEYVYKLLGYPSAKDYFPDTNMYNFYYKKNRMDSVAVTTTLILKYQYGEYQVVGWYNRQDWLKISDGNDTNRGVFTLGSSVEDVAKVMESPVTFEIYYVLSPTFGTYIKYKDGSTVSFNQDLKVTDWNNKGCLKVSYGASKPTYAKLTLGSTIKEVTNAIGTPLALGSSITTGKPNSLVYKGTSILFDETGKLIGWNSNTNHYISIGEKDATAVPIKIKVGTSLTDIIKMKGTPEVYDYSTNSITYGKVTYYMDYKKKVSRIFVYK